MVVWVLACVAALTAMPEPFWPEGSAAAQSPGEVVVASRAAQPGELLVVTATLAPSASEVRLGAFGRLAPAYALESGRWQAILGIDLDEKPGNYPVTVAVDGGQPVATAAIVAVQPKAFATRRLRVNPDFVSPPPAILERIVRENALLQDVLGRSAPGRLWTGAWMCPVPHRANSAFGTRSVFNGEPRNPHAGTDFLSPAGTPVRAPAAGRVVLARDLYFSGRTVIIDHGLDVFSQLLHLSRVDVQEGEAVAAGTVLGLVGATGRVTGAHLHWGLRVGGARVDPLSALALLGAQVPEGTAASRPPQ
jgi:murein DD-endopeptidase MepM/ murein hydrolase activator NlpD